MLTDLDFTTTTVTGLHFQASYLKFMNKLFGVTLYFLYLYRFNQNFHFGNHKSSLICISTLHQLITLQQYNIHCAYKFDVREPFNLFYHFRIQDTNTEVGCDYTMQKYTSSQFSIASRTQ